MHRSIAANHETAQRTGARIIHACGFDSIPSDLGVLADRRGGPGRRRRAGPHPPRGAHPQGRVQRRHRRLRPHPGRRAQGRQGRPPRGRRPVGPGPGRATPAPSRRHGIRPGAHDGRSGRAGRHGDQGVPREAGCRQRPLHRAVRHGCVQLPHRGSVRLAAGLRQGVPLRRVHGLRSRRPWCPYRRSGLGGPGRRAGRPRLRSDAGGPGPGPAEARGGAEPRGPGEGPPEGGRHRGGDERRAVPRPR